MVAAVWLMLSGLMYALQLSTGSFPKPLTEEEESYYLDRVENSYRTKSTPRCPYHEEVLRADG